MKKEASGDPAAARLRADQARRLERVRALVVALGPQQAADMAGVTRFKWYRYETGEIDIECVPLARFVKALGFPAEYVVTGAFSGLDADAIRRLVEMETLERLAAEEGKVLQLGPVRRGRPRQARKERTASEGTSG